MSALLQHVAFEGEQYSNGFCAAFLVSTSKRSKNTVVCFSMLINGFHLRFTNQKKQLDSFILIAFIYTIQKLTSSLVKGFFKSAGKFVVPFSDLTSNFPEPCPRSSCSPTCTSKEGTRNSFSRFLSSSERKGMVASL